MENALNGCAPQLRVGVRGGVGVLLCYAVMALADALGVLSAQAGLVGFSSTLFFIWFAVAPLPVGALCCRVGTVPMLQAALSVSVLACALLGVGMWSRWCSAVGFCLAGLSNVCLQVVVPVWAASRFSCSRLAGVVTGGLFMKTAVAVSFPFAVYALSGMGCWWLSLLPFAVVSAAACFVVKGATGGGDGRLAAQIPAFVGVRRVLKDPVVRCAVIAFAIAVVADVAFNLSVPGAVASRFGGDGASAGTVYAVWFGVKLPLMLVGSRLFQRHDARRFFGGAAIVALAGAVVMLACGGWRMYLFGVGLFAAGFANVYGHVFGAAAPRHPDDTPAVSALVVMSISSGALASPLLSSVGGLGLCAPEWTVLALVALLAPFAVFLSMSRGRP